MDVQSPDLDEKAFLAQPGPLAHWAGPDVHVLFHFLADDLRIGLPVPPLQLGDDAFEIPVIKMPPVLPVLEKFNLLPVGPIEDHLLHLRGKGP